ncbi:damage-control phosphatase ARMT1 family protein [Streptomyces sp. NBC_01190]|uniref:damage-control phosphatase ARMT1 family protein n=1 Tax=Streptomyces sp. NBC_01190 TaxID=2903767 RepID=UPI003863C760|nr:damage-control phosphatase ARMT1 family protein [Streptomyces sp. NBC_01190]
MSEPAATSETAAPPPDASVIIGGTPGTFARGVLTERHPALIRQVRDAFPYPPERLHALDALLAEIAGGSIAPLPAGAHDAEQWARWGRAYVGRSWFEVPFLWAESYFYRRLLDAVGYFAPGPWQGIDPFGPFKRAELAGDAVAGELAALDELTQLPAEEGDMAVLHGALWGNRADLGFRISSGEVADGTGRLLVDDGARLWRHLDADPDGTVHILADNAGRELVADLILIDHLLHTHRAGRVLLHLKPYPYFVSDATTADVVDCVRRIARAPGRAGRIGARLWQAMNQDRLSLRSPSFARAPLPYADLPDDLRADLATATLTIAKGDLNYRRLVGDRHWPATASFAALTADFPGGPLVALRTLKSDVVTGLDPTALAALDGSGEKWRTSGSYAVIQMRPGPGRA